MGVHKNDIWKYKNRENLVSLNDQFYIKLFYRSFKWVNIGEIKKH